MNGSANWVCPCACAKSAQTGILPPRLNKVCALQFLQATTFAGIAQLVEHLICNQEVRGSNPCVGTNKNKDLRAFLISPICAPFFKAYREAYGWIR